MAKYFSDSKGQKKPTQTNQPKNHAAEIILYTICTNNERNFYFFETLHLLLIASFFFLGGKVVWHKQNRAIEKAQGNTNLIRIAFWQIIFIFSTEKVFIH